MFKKTSNVASTITEQIKDVEGCLINFENFMRALTAGDASKETLGALKDGVMQMEAAADRSLNMMIESLGTGTLLPSTRSDLINIATACDSVANKCETISLMMVIRKFEMPKVFGERIMKILEITRNQFELLEKAIKKLFSDFNKLMKDHSILYDIRDLETDVDKVELSLYTDIYEMDLDLAEKNQISQFVELICDISDIIENIADKIQIMLITRKA